MLFIRQPRMLSAFFAIRAHRWLMFNLLSTKTSKAFFCKMEFPLEWEIQVLDSFQTCHCYDFLYTCLYITDPLSLHFHIFY